MSLNVVILTGNVVRDFEKKTDKLGIVSIAQNIWNGTESVGHFFNIVLLGEKTVANAEKFLKKGANITIQGSIENNNFTDKDGNKRSTLQIKSFSFDINKFAPNDGINQENQKENYNQEIKDPNMDENINWDELKF